MTTVILEPRTAEAVDRLLASGRYESSAAVVSEAMALMIEREAVWAELDDAITQGLRSADAGRLIPAKDAAKELRRRYAPTV